MSQVIIKRHNFDIALRNIDSFLNKIPSNSTLPKVIEEDEGFFWSTKHKVTGEEMNAVIKDLQNHLIRINDLSIDTIKEFKQVYNAFDALDKEYVAGILSSVNDADMASRAAKKASEENTQSIQCLNKAAEKLVKLSDEFSDFKTKCRNELDDLQLLIPILSKAVQDIKQLQNAHDSFEKQYEEIASFSNFLNKKNLFEDIELLQDCVNEHNTQFQFLESKHSEEKARLDFQIKMQGDTLGSQITKLSEQQEEVQKKYHKRLVLTYVISGVSLVLSLVGISLAII